MDASGRLLARFRRIAVLGEASAVLNWDAAAMMPSGGSEARGEQLATLAGLSHALLTDPAVADELDEAGRTASGSASGTDEAGWSQANLRLMRHAHRRATALPTGLVEAQVRANTACEAIWREARLRSDFAVLVEPLSEVVRLTSEAAQALSAQLGLSPYDCLMDGFQPGITAAEARPVFDRYERFLRDALPRAEEIQARHDHELGLPLGPSGRFGQAAQETLCRHLAALVGLEPEHFRLDRSAHPFCGGTPADVRITTRYDEADPAQSLLGVLHESGHALYERGLPAAWSRLPVGEAAGMAAHESQSLIVEMQACLSEPFLGWLAPVLAEAFPGSDPATWNGANLGRLWRRVERSYIRVEADELTYPAHVVLRFRLEQALMDGTLAVADLPAAWAEGMQALLGVSPPDDRRGCLQDIHWFDGLFGYFPSYSLGAMAAAQLMAAARNAVPGLDEALGRGEFAPLLGWLRPEVHGHGARLGFNDLLRSATGSPLDPSHFEAHLTRRYLG